MNAILLIGAMLASGASVAPADKARCAAKPFSLVKPAQPAPAAEAKAPVLAPAKLAAASAKPRAGCKKKPA